MYVCMIVSDTQLSKQRLQSLFMTVTHYLLEVDFDLVMLWVVVTSFNNIPSQKEGLVSVWSVCSFFKLAVVCMSGERIKAVFEDVSVWCYG